MEELAKTLDNQPGRFQPIRCDVAREENILRAFKWVTDNLGPVHILVNNAGLTRPTTLTSNNLVGFFIFIFFMYFLFFCLILSCLLSLAHLSNTHYSRWFY